MDSIRTLLLARTHTVVLDPDRVASAATRPTRDVDLEKLELELAERGYVMSLDLAMTLRRLPHQAIQELRGWILDTLTIGPASPEPRASLPRTRAVTTPPPSADSPSPYLRRMLSWLTNQPVQPCPWCGQRKQVGALDPCGHLVCRSCWESGSFAGCPICHRRVAVEPFARAAPGEPIQPTTGELRLLHLGFDLAGAARDRFEQLIGRTTPLVPDERTELEVVIDAMGPKTVRWLPVRIPIRETMAIAVARLWVVAADRTAMVDATRGHLETATDVLRVAVVIHGGNPALVEPIKLRSVSRSLRRAVLHAIDGLTSDTAIEDMWRRRGLWKRLGERLHPYEHAQALPRATLAFAAVRQTRLDQATFGAAVRAAAPAIATVRIADDRARVVPWASAVEDRLRAGDPRAAAERLAQRPTELIRRIDQLVRVAELRQPDALPAVISAVEAAIARGTPPRLLGLAAQLARRSSPWPRRVFVPSAPAGPDRNALRAWLTDDRRPPLRSDAAGAVVALVRTELIARAAARRNFARAVIDRALDELALPLGERASVHASPELGDPLALFAHSWRRIAARTGADRAVAALVTAGARPTLWDLAVIHAVARANIVYVRERSGAFASYRRRDNEHALGRLARVDAGDDNDGVLDDLPPANAPTWFAVVRADLVLPEHSAGYVLDARARREDSLAGPLPAPPASSPSLAIPAMPIEWLTAGDLLGELVRA